MPSDLTHQAARRQAILEILKSAPISRQGDLVERLRTLGHDATQSSVSRDLKDLGVAKVGDRYLAPQNVREPGMEAFDKLAGFVQGFVNAGPNLTIVRTSVGAAQSVAVALDSVGWPEILGTISGDDTIFIATGGSRHQVTLLSRLEQVFPRQQP